MKLGRIQDSIVVEIVEVPDEIDGRPASVDDYFHPELGFEVVGSEVELGWANGANGFAPPPQPVVDPAAQKAALKGYAAAKRYAVETGGITVSGSEIRTDRESQAMINGAYNLVTVSPQPVQFKTANGFVTLSAADVQSIAMAVGQHVQASFAKEADVSASIDAGTITDTAGVDAAFAAVQ